jgi:5-methylthioribose kinase
MCIRDRYYKAGAFDKGNKLANRLMQIYEQNVDYYLSLSPEFRGNYDEDINEAYGFFNSMKQIADQYNQKDISQRVDKFMNERMGGVK